MSSRVLAAMLAMGCVTAAAGGAYIAVRQNGAASPPDSVAPMAPTPAAPGPAARPVSETEAIVDRAPVAPRPDDAPTAEREAAPTRVAPERPARAAKPEPVRKPDPPHRTAAPPVRAAAPVTASRPVAPSVVPTPVRPAIELPPVAPISEAQAEPPRPTSRPPVREPQFDEVVLPASSVLGLRVETPLSSERTRLEDRVEAHVTRDVTSEGRVAIPAGSRVIGSVTMVERGGKMKERARLGLRFHTLVLADGQEVPLRTETIIREGDSPSNESARKIGGAAVGGAILGAILGGGKGAVMGGAAGAAGGSAAVMAGDRNAATLPAGTTVSVRLAGPATIEVERPPQ
jgi:hypothetical protein